VEKIFITGGSGTVGESFIENNFDKYEIYSYSRNEKSQVALKRKFPKVNIILGSVEDKYDLDNSLNKIKPRIIIHAAALKHVDTAEKQPIELIKSNIIGSKNIIESAKANNVSITVGISTDKACEPNNLYGYSKRIMEKMFLEANNDKNIFCCTRFGNVAGSNGSVIPFWLNQKSNNEPLTLTDAKMNRLMLSRKEVSEIIEKCIEEGRNKKGGFILSKIMKNVVMKELANCISKDIKIIGLRPGEELDEDLISERELDYTKVDGEYVFIENEINKDKTKRLKKSLSSKNAKKMNFNELVLLINEVEINLKRDFYY
jgi:UDP-N-acetylglucosamine 4,6-dehydratase/5-epimerase